MTKIPHAICTSRLSHDIKLEPQGCDVQGKWGQKHDGY